MIRSVPYSIKTINTFLPEERANCDAPKPSPPSTSSFRPSQSSLPLPLFFLVPTPFRFFAGSTYASSLLSSPSVVPPFFFPSAFEDVGASGTLLTICSRKSSCSSPWTACFRCAAVTRLEDFSRAIDDDLSVSEMMKSSSALAVLSVSESKG